MLFEFFRIVSNTYFLINAILQCMEFSPLTPISMGGPLVVVLFAWMARQTLEDVVSVLLPLLPLLLPLLFCAALSISTPPDSEAAFAPSTPACTRFLAALETCGCHVAALSMPPQWSP